MRIIFMGTAELACPCLEAVAQLAGHEIVSVITQPDRPKGRDLQPASPPVKVLAAKLGLPIHQPSKMRDPAAIALEMMPATAITTSQIRVRVMSCPSLKKNTQSARVRAARFRPAAAARR